MNVMKLPVLCLFSIALSSGCTSLEEVERQPRDKGVADTFSVTLDEARGAAKEALDGLKFNIDYEKQIDSASIMIIANKKDKVPPHGQIVRIIVYGIEGDGSGVIVFSAPKVVTQMAPRDWSYAVLDSISLHLGVGSEKIGKRRNVGSIWILIYVISIVCLMIGDARRVASGSNMASLLWWIASLAFLFGAWNTSPWRETHATISVILFLIINFVIGFGWSGFLYSRR